MIFLLDANLPPQVARALQALDQSECQFRHSSAEFGRDAPDETIFAGIQERGWFLMTLDVKMTRHPAQRRAIIESGLGVFVFTGRAQRSFHQLAAFILSVVEQVMEKAENTTRPFIWGISDKRVFTRLDRDAS